jgi:metal-responsive CopG/Arc/MetJ family transcriptional regulator
MSEPVSKPETDARRRLQFDFSDRAVERLDEMVQLMGASSRAEVVRRALLLMDHVLVQQSHGSTLQLISPSGKAERVLIL